ncbi:hypothetical protein [Streptomyces sp. NPDC002785]|uniref:hypothetical protein n=1 Tax=Streptomyces sp. NPDC002785 TaxID=3154543 RepID=UPI00332D7BA5
MAGVRDQLGLAVAGAGGEIPYTLVGRHRRIRLVDLRQYLREGDAHCKDAADELIELDQELGLT